MGLVEVVRMGSASSRLTINQTNQLLSRNASTPPGRPQVNSQTESTLTVTVV